MPTKQTSRLPRARAATMVIISLALKVAAAGVSIALLAAPRAVGPVRLRAAAQHLLVHPGAEALAIAGNLIPLCIERVGAPIVALRVRGVGSARDHGDRGHGPRRPYHRVQSRRREVIDRFLDGHDGAPRGEHGLLLHADDALEQ